ncbi:MULTISPECIES: tyrosine-type recombinase/integrase [unclassified Mesorhizobium]|uniref:tyrosine-type recombinase/integrase n=1 Tax=unclassified Mesorhizobium TaxID=325217 RepID=UPI000FCC5BFD|nr:MULTISPECIES: tyrosine-type recombinase/integrase [unclassified Mesorhizobium]RUY28908.1 hypothetical protein EN979_12060 [Mesorhizobium sp. M7A.F.Ca.US.001.04.2.1]RUY38441.1 hypothetical protein EN978_24040 [Mesorhizobium sp. M7A.F.Ca.US.001.04.1.1]RVA07725.1 hypothetical protein EN938_02120 [Mesorhizobium sp. M7A.F.Ca.US.001.02.1.1]
MAKSTPYLKRAPNGVYYVHWTDNRIGKRVSTKKRDLDDARMALGAFLLSGEPIVRVPRMSALWAIYRAKHAVVKLVSPESADLCWKHLRPHFGALPASDVTQDAVDEYLAKRTTVRNGRAVKPQTVLKELAYLKAALKFCAERGFVSIKYVRKLELPAAGEPRRHWLREGEIERLKAAARAHRIAQGGETALRLSRVERFIALALETAGRQQALFELTWDRVDFETRVVDLDVPGRKKTNKRRAFVPISDALLPVLERAYDERINDLVLDNQGDVWATLQLVAINAGLADESKRARHRGKPKATGVSANVLRHTAATNMARRGAPLWKIGKVLGNSTEMIERVYAKHQPDDLRDVVDLISNDPKKPK